MMVSAVALSVLASPLAAITPIKLRTIALSLTTAEYFDGLSAADKETMLEMVNYYLVMPKDPELDDKSAIENLINVFYHINPKYRNAYVGKLTSSENRKDIFNKASILFYSPYENWDAFWNAFISVKNIPGELEKFNVVLTNFKKDTDERKPEDRNAIIRAFSDPRAKGWADWRLLVDKFATMLDEKYIWPYADMFAHVGDITDGETLERFANAVTVTVQNAPSASCSVSKDLVISKLEELKGSGKSASAGAGARADAVPAKAVPVKVREASEWKLMKQEERRDSIFTMMLDNPATCETFKLVTQDPAKLKETAHKLLGLKEVEMPDLPDEVRRFQDHFRDVGYVLQVAKNVMNWKVQYKLSDAEALEFLAFKKKFLTVPDDYKDLSDGQKLRLLQEIKESIKNKKNYATLEQTTAVLFAFFEKTLPIDLPLWPDLEDNAEASFNQFLKESIVPYAQLIGKERPQVYVDTFLELGQEHRQEKVKAGIKGYALALKKDREKQLSDFGVNPVLKEETFASTTFLQEILLAQLDEEDKRNPALAARINHVFFGQDPFLSILKEPDERLRKIRAGLKSAAEEVEALKRDVYGNLPEEKKDEAIINLIDETFKKINFEDEKHRNAIARFRRIYEIVKEKDGAVAAACVIADIAAKNQGRCIDGVRNGVTDAERRYVYTLNGKGINNPLIAIGLNAAKLFLDHRMDALKGVVDHFFDSAIEDDEDFKEFNTYCWLGMHRALLLGFGLTGEYGEIRYPYYAIKSEFSIDEFIRAYFQGGTIHRNPSASGAKGNPFKNIDKAEAFTVNKMVALVMKEIRGPDKVAAAGAGAEDEAEDEEAKGVVDSSFDDELLTSAINSDLELRREYAKFQEGPTAENPYFQGMGSLRKIITEKTVGRFLRGCGYIEERDEF